QKQYDANGVERRREEIDGRDIAGRAHLQHDSNQKPKAQHQKRNGGNALADEVTGALAAGAVSADTTQRRAHAASTHRCSPPKLSSAHKPIGAAKAKRIANQAVRSASAGFRPAPVSKTKWRMPLAR